MRRVLAVAVLVVSSVLFAGGAAQAATLVVPDARGDVAIFTGYGFTPAPRVTQGDIVRTTFKHTGNAVVVRVKFRSLSRRGDHGEHQVRILTDTGLDRRVSVLADPTNWSGTMRFTTHRNRTLHCAVHHRIRYARDVVRFRIPRSCLDDPSWVRLGSRTSWSAKGVHYSDDALLDGAEAGHIRLSRRVHHD
ncbi:hypothetical protein [Nocardioides limicola]|uniref:hypothetical protein n=1 Tax=Nocardioides limicola TaxID=2803368 RepID=UPI00193C670C|nr:hypothetical protein [Nocardioides sp. DJM-14]